MARKEKVRCIGKRRGVLQLGISFQAENLLRELAIMKWGLGFPEFLEPRVQLIIQKNPAGPFRLLNVTMWNGIWWLRFS